MQSALRFAALAILTALSAPLSAQDRDVPYWASVRVAEVNMRVGPSGSYGINWVYHRKQLPLKVLRLKEGWRLVEDPDGARGWVLGQFLTLERTAIVKGERPAGMRDKGAAGARLMWKLEPGVVGKLGDCDAGWCRFVVGAHNGFVEQDRLWGAGEP